MTSHPDKLFRDGLGDYQKVAPPTAWVRIESSLDRKRTLSPWLKIAAGLLILIGASVILLDQTKDKQQMAKGREQRAESAELRANSRQQLEARLGSHPIHEYSAGGQ